MMKQHEFLYLKKNLDWPEKEKRLQRAGGGVKDEQEEQPHRSVELLARWGHP